MMNSSPVESEVSSPVAISDSVHICDDQLEVYLRAQHEFENQLLQTFNELLSNGIDAATAEYEVLCRLCISGGGSSTVVEEDTLNKYIIDGRLRRDEAVRALVIQRELDSLREKGLSLLDSITELILRLNNKNTTNPAIAKKSQQHQQQQQQVKKKKIRELANLSVVSKNKVRVHRRQESDDAVVVSAAGKEAFILDGESPRPQKKLRKDGGVAEREISERKRMRAKATFKSAGKFN